MPYEENDYTASGACYDPCCTGLWPEGGGSTEEPDVTEMRAICELSVMDCYYHNVAKYFEEDAQKGFLGHWKKG